ncbi:ATP-binding protein [Roseovarius sp. M141]|uniref:ATP-binding protein n=1 Tax=Roseovarius sp. M141 TaxID=2583806 RepID=UPI0020CFDCF4|nr:ATP-binding protein [Roseovarius sp. M141]MCQ0092537.1 ATP-binding protein [Roseovarius sp. M141]
MNTTLNTLILRNASLSGGFDPLAMLNSVDLGPGARQYRDGALRVLSLQSTEHLQSGGYRWMVTPDCRRRALREFLSAAMIAQTLNAAPALEKGDVLGQILRTILRKEIPAVPERRAEETDDAYLARQLAHASATYDAAQFAEVVPALDTKWIESVRNAADLRIKTLQRRQDIQIVLPTKLYGRGHYKRILSRHLRALEDDPRPLLLTGAGGIGKSALVASLIHGWEGRADAPMIIFLDFDRRQLVGGSPVQMVHEVLRQLSVGLANKKLSAEKKEALIEFLRDVRRQLPALDTSGGERTYSSQFGRMLSAIFPRFQEPAAKPLHMMNIAMFFDSFEAVNRQGGGVVRTLMDIENSLRDNGLTNLRTIVSGRAAPLPEPDLTEAFGDEARRIDIGGLGAVSGARLLEHCDKAGVFRTVQERQTASDALGGHPLALRVLAKFAASHEGGATSLLEDLAHDPRFKAEFAQVYLYERILQRISDEDVRALAHPGLVLRQLNKDMIRLVLAVPCFGAPITSDRAADLMTRLRDEYWLVEEEPGDFPARHRSDLRRLMLPGLFAGPRPSDSGPTAARKTTLRNNARAVCVAAADLFEFGPPRGDAAHVWWRVMPPGVRQVEAAYYRALGTDLEPSFDLDYANRMHTILGEDLDTLPLVWVARVKALRGEPLSAAEWDQLPPNLRENAEAQTFKRMKVQGVGMGRVGAKTAPRKKAADVSGAGTTPEPSGIAADATPQHLAREIGRGFLLGQFDRASSLGPRYFDARRSEGLSVENGDDFWGTAVWQSILLAGALEGTGWEDDGHLSDLPPPMPDLYAAAKGASTGASDSCADALIRALENPDGWHAPDRMPVRANRLAGRQIMEVLAMSGARRKEPFVLSARAFCLAVSPTDPSGVPPGEPPDLPGDLRRLLNPLYGAAPVTLGAMQEIYRLNEPIAIYPEELMKMSDPARVLFADMLRGLSPELYEPTGAFLRDQSPARVGEMVAHLTKDPGTHWPQDLRSDRKIPYREEEFGTVIETADQCGLLAGLLDLMAQDDARVAPLLRMHNLIGEWFFARDPRQGADNQHTVARA